MPSEVTRQQTPSALKLPSPVYGVIFLFKYPVGEKPSDIPKDGKFDEEAAERLFFASQTIQNACGTQALLSVLLNKQNDVDIGPQLLEFKDFTGAFSSEVRESNPRLEYCIYSSCSFVAKLCRTLN